MVQPRSRRLSLPKPVLVWSGCSLGTRKDREWFGGLSTLSLVRMASLWDDITRSGEWIHSVLPPFHKSDINWKSNPYVQLQFFMLRGGWVGTEPREGNYPSLRRCPLPTKKAELCWKSLGMVCGRTGFWPSKDYIRCVPFRLRSHAHCHPAAGTRTAQAECQHP